MGYHDLILFDINKNYQNTEIIHFLSRDKCKKIIKYMEKNDEGCFLTDISKDLGMHFNTVKNYIKKLEEFKLVSNKDTKIYFVNKARLHKIL